MNVANARRLLVAATLAVTASLPSESADAGVILTQSESFFTGGASASTLGGVQRAALAIAGAEGFMAEADSAISLLVSNAPVASESRAHLVYALPSRLTSLDLSASALSGTPDQLAFANATTRHVLTLTGTNGGTEELDLYLDLELFGVLLAGPGSSLSLQGFFDIVVPRGPGLAVHGEDRFGLDVVCIATHCEVGSQQRSVYLGRLPAGSSQTLMLDWLASVEALVIGQADRPVVSALSLVRLDRALLTLRGVEVVGPPGDVPAPTGATILLAAGVGLALLTARRRGDGASC